MYSLYNSLTDEYLFMCKKMWKRNSRSWWKDLIEEVDGGATPWVAPIVVASKPKSPNEVRICVDMREPNRAIKRTRYLIPTVDDIL